MTAGLFYFPILLAAGRFGFKGAIITALVAGLLAGPLMPMDVGLGIVQDPSLWSGRIAFFLILGLVMAAVVVRLQLSLARELRVLKEERDLAFRKAAVISTVSHEFRTPLTIIQGVSRTLEHQGLVSEEGRPLLRGLDGAAKRLADLVSTVAIAAEGAEGSRFVRRRPIVFRELCRAVIDGLDLFDGPRRVQIDVSPDAEIFDSDSDLLRHLLHNLAENALKFSAQGAPVLIGVARSDDAVEIRIRDHGPGVDERFVAGAFDPFTQGDQSLTRSKGGLGIGLFAASRLTELLNGRIELLRHPEGGTEAVVRLPSLPLTWTAQAPEVAGPVAWETRAT